MGLRHTSILSLVYGGALTGSFGQVASPNYPNQYPHNVNYVWTITVDIGMRIRVTINAIDIESVANCYFDYLRVWLFLALLGIDTSKLDNQDYQG